MTVSDGCIRLAGAADIPALYDICLRTANAGDDASALYSDPHYPGQRFSVPYAVLEPRFAFVMERDGRVLGYVVATPDTVTFESRLEAQWWPALREAYAGRRAVTSFDQPLLDAIYQPALTPERLTLDWPAHLHINLLPEAQGSGWGRKLIEKQLETLRSAGVKGVHLGASLQNEKVCAFYQRLGFQHILRSNAIYMGQTL
ncbi:GNAT family N-acetyltransferase [Affinibrenneria salicis]|uniref:GNAT family N-acetyltransferase n=1 Tax=Affinibrenneria salicis TaxID=2590031 RepID=A0A5J5FV47_9GAMM|nr:GNAT family N-acetyltransferase [Affinibrenneria salicis]KAA8997399.1 GNAT family N-acetyltransferase [Affinibrenneria salicis]